MVIDFSQVEKQRLAKYHDLTKFDCDDNDINEFLKKDALVYQEMKIATTTIFIYKEEIIGFFSATSDSIRLNLSEKEAEKLDTKRISEFPAIKVARLAVDKGHHKQGVGTLILKYAIGHILECSEMVAVRFVTVDSYPARVGWYHKLGFVKNEHKDYKDQRNVSMRYDLHNDG